LHAKSVNYFSTLVGWDDIAYSFLIGGDGQVYEGRGWNRVGSHTYRYNYKSLALAFIGNFNNTLPGASALNAAQKLLACGVQKNAITPAYSLYGHRDVRDTTCPGYTLYNAIRKWPHYNISTGIYISLYMA
jgi:N-acetylmuramoyl-L-alanine amidase